MNFVDNIVMYYQTEANHGLVTSLATGAVLITVSLLLWFLSTHLSIQKGVATVIFVGGLIFFIGGYFAGKTAKSNLQKKIELYQKDRKTFLADEVQKVEKIHKNWLVIKLFWTVFIATGVALTFASPKTFLTGIAIGLMIVGSIGLIEETISYQHNEKYRIQVLEENSTIYKS